MPSENPNQFFDRFKFLTIAAGKIDTMRAQITQYLNEGLPSRILSKANIFNLTLDVVQDLSTLNLAYVEDSLNENNMLTAQTETAVRGLATLPGHRATRPISSRGAVVIKLLPGIQNATPTLLLDTSTVVRCVNNNLQYLYDQSDDILQIPTSISEFTLQLIEGTKKSQEFVADGLKLYTIYLDDQEPIENYYVNVYVDGILWTKYDGKYDMGVSTEGYLVRNGFDNQVDIIFGDGVHGITLANGATVKVEYITTSGEAGNVTEFSDQASFEFSAGIRDAQGDEIDVTDYVSIAYHSGMSLGSNGENIETTRQIAGYNSRSLVFAQPENMKAFMSRFTTLSHVDSWTEEDSLIFNLLVLPNVSAKISTFSDYLDLPEESLVLTANQKSEIILMLNNTRRQMTSSEVKMHDPVLKKYAMFCYIDAVVFDEASFKDKIYNNISKLMLDETFADVDLNNDQIIAKSAISNAIYDMSEVRRVAVNIFSEANETARIKGTYTAIETVVDGSKKVKREVEVEVPAGFDPNLGFSELGDIFTEELNEIPILRAGFDKYASDENHVTLTKPIYIFIKEANGNYKEL